MSNGEEREVWMYKIIVYQDPSVQLKAINNFVENYSLFHPNKFQIDNITTDPKVLLKCAKYSQRKREFIC